MQLYVQSRMIMYSAEDHLAHQVSFRECQQWIEQSQSLIILHFDFIFKLNCVDVFPHNR